MVHSKDDGFEPDWLNEQDWLVELIMLPKDDPFDDNEEFLDYIGRLSVFAFATDTRLLAQVGAPDVPGYELWFSFNGDRKKQQFLQMVRDDGYADPDEEACFFPPPSLHDLPDLRPIAHVFPKPDCDRIIAIAAATAAMMESDSGRIN